MFSYFLRIESHLLESLDSFIESLSILIIKKYSRLSLDYGLESSSLSIGDHGYPTHHRLYRYEPEVFFGREEECLCARHETFFLFVRYAISPYELQCSPLHTIDILRSGTRKSNSVVDEKLWDIRSLSYLK